MTLHRAGLCLALICFTLPAAADYSVRALKDGVQEGAALAEARKRGLEPSAMPQADGHFLTRPADNRIVAMLWTCKGRVWSESNELQGGAVAFAKRIAQNTREFGPGQASASSDNTKYGEVNTVEVKWQVPGGTVQLAYTPGAQNIRESQWLQHAAPSVCND